jgi:hypothetical protein
MFSMQNKEFYPSIYPFSSTSTWSIVMAGVKKEAVLDLHEKSVMGGKGL